MKPAFRFPLWLLPVCWGITVLLGNLLFMLLIRFHPSVNYLASKEVFAGFVIQSAMAAVPSWLVSSIVVQILNRHSRMSGHMAALGGILILFSLTVICVQLLVPLRSTYDYAFHIGAVMIEEMGYIPPLAVYCIAGWIVFGMALWILRPRKQQRENEETID